MEEIVGTSNRVLEIDLATGETQNISISDTDRSLYIGGKGTALKLLSERLKPGTDPLSPENVLVFTTGIYMGSGVPCSARFSAVTKSPQTGVMVSSSCGGPFGMALKTAGYDGLILRGKAKLPSYLVIDNGITMHSATHLQGMDTVQTQDTLKMPRTSGAVVIGPAGENLVKLANASSGHRFLGRGGIGAVLGSKNIKAIVAHGKKFKMKAKATETLKTLKKTGTKFINRNPVTGTEYRKLGTLSHVNKCNDAGILPVRNFTDGSHPEAHKVSGELYAEKYTTGHNTCKPCTILCGHKGEFNGKKMAIPEYESAGLLGPNLEVFDPVAIAEWNDLCGRLGLDTISTGSVLGWVMEATEKGLVKSELKFGHTENISEAITNIAYRRAFGNDMAEGVRTLSQKYGGEDFAIHVKGMEIAAYDPRGAWGQALGYAVANRGGCHLSAPVFSLEATMGYINPYTSMAKVTFTDYFENLFNAINAMHGCQFTSFAYMLEPFVAKNTPKFLLGLTMQIMPKVALALMDVSMYNKSFQSITGVKMSQKEMLEAGKRIHVLERYMNTLEGITAKDDTLPERMLNEARKSDTKKRMIPLDKMIKRYYKVKGFDENGIPTAKTLKKLQIEV